MKIYEFSKTLCSIEWLQQLSLTYFSLINLFYYIDHLPIKLIKISPYNMIINRRFRMTTKMPIFHTKHFEWHRLAIIFFYSQYNGHYIDSIPTHPIQTQLLRTITRAPFFATIYLWVQSDPGAPPVKTHRRHRQPFDCLYTGTFITVWKTSTINQPMLDVVWLRIIYTIQRAVVFCTGQLLQRGPIIGFEVADERFALLCVADR